MKFNTVEKRNRTKNLAEGEAFKQTDKLELVSLLLTSFVEDQFYRSAETQVDRLSDLVAGLSDKKFAAKAAVFARNEFGMRSITHVLAGEIANTVKGEKWTKHFFNRVVRRPDDVTEILAYHLSKRGKPIPNAMKKGLGMALSRFDDYQLGKYKARKANLSLIDAVNLCHPPHNSSLERLVNGTLRSPDTWEVRLTQAGQTAESEKDKEEKKREVWADLVKERKIGYFALLRNLRNIMEQSPDVVNDALEMLTDERLIKRSLVMPFRYMTAIDNIRDTGLELTREVVMALNKAVDTSLKNIPTLDGKSLVVVDVSGSMTWAREREGNRPAILIAALFAAVLFKSNDADLMLFDNKARYLGANPLDTTLTIADYIHQKATGGSTNFHAPFQAMNKAYDRIVFLSDMQGWVGYDVPTSELANYQKEYGVHPYVYSFDLTGYGSLQFPEDRVMCLAGFSNKVFDIMSTLEQDKNALIARIDKVNLK